MRIGLIARSDNTGLGNQTRELAKMLNPDKVLLINSYKFKQSVQHPEWYSKYKVIESNGFATDSDVVAFLKNLDVVISCEIFYNSRLIHFAKKRGIKTILQYNYEFLENLQFPDLDLPDVLASPSLWNIDRVEKLFGNQCKVIHLPPPTDEKIFSNAMKNNISKDHNKILHVAGTIAVKDRNGTNTVLEMLKYSKAEYELVIKAQQDFDINIKDSRVTVDLSSPDNREDLYSGFDAMVLPRRYAGLCLPMNEALLSALPVFMTDISPNNKILPKEWLIKSDKIDRLQTKATLDVYGADPKQFAMAIDNYIMIKNKTDLKQKAFDIGYNNFSPNNLKEKYLNIFK